MKFIASSIIFFLAQLPVMFISLFVVPFMLQSKKWDGKTTWFGNFKWGRGEEHYKAKATTKWKQWWFLCIRNPVSNFGKQVLAVNDAPWVWLVDKQVYKSFHWKYGWKDQTVDTPKRTFIYRPWIHKPSVKTP